MVPVHGIKPRFVANQATVLSLDDTGIYGSGYKDRTCLVAGSKPAADTSQLSHIIFGRTGELRYLALLVKSGRTRET